MNASVAALPNSTTEIEKRVAAGKITWAGPIIMLVARSVFAVICQALVAAIFYSGSADAWNEAGHWWTVYGTVIDAGCLVLLFWLTRREGIRFLDLGNYSRERWKRDVLIGLGLFVPMLLLFAAPIQILETVLYGGSVPRPTLPMVGTLYSLIIWPVIWAFAEGNTYLGYSLPRLEALTGRKWLAVVVVGVFWALQHVFLPLRLEWQWLVSHFAGYVLGGIVYCLLYLRWRRLLPMHVSHWAHDLVGVLVPFIAALAGGG
jgi:membrane protease YdiL (CAAX protease family)